MIILGGGALAMRVGYGGRGFMNGVSALIRGSSLSTIWSTGRWQPPGNQEEGSHQTRNLPAPWSSQTLRLLEVTLCYLSHHVYVILLHGMCYTVTAQNWLRQKARRSPFWKARVVRFPLCIFRAVIALGVHFPLLSSRLTRASVKVPASIALYL